MPQHELVLVLNARVDEIAEQPTLDTIIWLSRIVDRPIRQAATDQAVSIVAPAGLALARHRLAARIDATHMRAHGAAQAFGIAGAVGIDVFEIIELFGRQSALGAIAVRRQCQRNTVAPASAYLGGEQFGINPVLVRLKKVFEPDYVRPDHLENGEAAVQTELLRLWHQIILGIVPQHKQPGFARLLVIPRISLRATTNSGLADAVGVAEVNLESGNMFAVP